MTIEVFGTVIGTAVQGQIVGMANVPCINNTFLSNSSSHSVHDNNSQNLMEYKIFNEVRGLWYNVEDGFKSHQYSAHEILFLSLFYRGVPI